MISFILNQQVINTDTESGLTILDFVRYQQNLRGTKIGCREGDCGACTVLVGELQDGKMHYQSMTSCLMPLANAQGKHIVTVEGINMQELSPVQQAVVDEGGTQCGFCTVGFIVSLTGYCMNQQQANYTDAIASIDGNICRCTGYKSLERACETIVKDLSDKKEKNAIKWLVENQFLPKYFKDIPKRLKALQESLLPLSQNGKVERIPVGGGTDLYVQRPEEMIHRPAKHLFDNKAFKTIHLKEDYIYIGAESTATDLEQSEIMQSIFPRIKEHLKLVSSTPIRNMGTVAGNLVNASPIGDLTIFFLALNSEIILSKKGKERTVSLKDFYLDYKKLDKKDDEIVHWIRFKKPAKKVKFNFEKVCKRTHLDIASVNSAGSILLKQDTIELAHFSVGGVGPTPKYLEKTSRFLEGKKLNPQTIQEAYQILDTEISPISDARGAASYKRLLARQLFFAHFITWYPEVFEMEVLV